jgi:hypothetical protein
MLNTCGIEVTVVLALATVMIFPAYPLKHPILTGGM